MPENKEGISGLTIKSLLLLFLLTVLFFWKILLTHQFSILTWLEATQQWYSWLNFCVVNLKHGSFPLWDPYTGGGSLFAGEMQTGAFNPLNLLVALFPLSRNGVLSPHTYHQWYAFTHFLGACFMFALVREMKLSRFSALVAGICFSFGGFIIQSSWRHMYESAIWLPLVFLMLLRALGTQKKKRSFLYASASGLMLGFTILAGGLHIAIMQGLVVISFVIFTILQSRAKGESYRGQTIAIPIMIGIAVLVVGACAGAVQLIPSMEFGNRAFRWIGHNAPPMAANKQIPYAYLKDYLAPNAFIGLLFPFATTGSGEVINPYFGVFPLLAAIIGIMRCWSNSWVRYLSGLTAVVFLYTLGELSFLHGSLYATLPYLWIVREPGRFIYLMNFALPILAAFGIDTLLNNPPPKSDWQQLNRVLHGIVIVCAIALTVSAIYRSLTIDVWTSFSILMIFASYGLFQFIIHGQTGISSRVLVVALILFDLNAFNWLPRNKIDEANSGQIDHLERLMSCRGAAKFLKSQPAPFRVRIDTDPKPNIGHVFQVPIANSTGGAALKDKAILSDQISNLLNTRYILKPASANEAGAIYQDSAWKVYQNPNAYPAAWIVHETMIEPSIERLNSRIYANEIDFGRFAVLNAPIGMSLEARVNAMPEPATFKTYSANRLELDVQTQSRGMLVLSELFYPGWRATVNGEKATIYKINGVFRGIVVPEGRSRITLQYAPISVFVGGFISLITFFAVLLGFAFHWRRSNLRR
jgi:hypothetical protein